MKQRGFTLIELLVVIAVIGLLSGIVLVNLSGTREKASRAKAESFASSVDHSLGAYAVGIWDFDGNAQDRSGHSNHGIVTGATPTTDRKGQEDKAYSFDGADDFISIPAAANLNFTTQDFSLSTWVYWDTYAANKIILWKGSFRTRGWYLRTAPTNTIDYLINHELTTTRQVAKNNIVGAGAWYHIVVARTGVTVKIYVNGIDQTSTHVDMPGIPDNSTDILTLASMRGISQFVNEDMDDVRVYNRALTTVQVEKLYAEGKDKYFAAADL